MSGVIMILSFGAGWLVAQVMKGLLLVFSGRVKDVKAVWRALMGTGGMPSSHAASVMALCSYVFFSQGWSEILAVCLCFSLIVLYDAMHVRYAVGEQGKVLNLVAGKTGVRAVKVVEGHTGVQVVVGSVVGILVGWWVAFLTGLWLI